MIDVLRIKNLALIEDLEINFDKGLNIITGETGAGKSIIVNSLQLLLGKRANIDLIRSNEEMCEVEAVFNLDDEEDYLIVKRIISKNNKNKIKINGEFVTLQKLKEVTQSLIDFSAQDQFLFDKENQLFIYDLFCKLKNKREKFIELYKIFQKKKKDIENSIKKREKILENLDFMKYQLKELEEINLEEIDEEELKSKISYLENAEIIKETLNFVLHNIDNNLTKVSELKEKISEILKLKPSFEEILKILENIDIEINEISNLCLNEISDLPEDLEEFNELILLDDRIKSLKKKFKKNNIIELIELKSNLKKEIEKIENFDFEIENLKKEYEILNKKLNDLANNIHNIRLQNKEKFENEIVKILKELNMEYVKFVVDIKKLDNIIETGKTGLEFLISTNEGEEPKPITLVASGGERSRIMLALKSFLSEFLKIPVLVFDEIDSGTGGKTAFVIGKLLKKISKNHQVFAITHFPQVAAFADNHYKVFKIIENGKTFTKIKKLNDKERIEEISRMISGNISEKSKISAKELLNEAEKSYC